MRLLSPQRIREVLEVVEKAGFVKAEFNIEERKSRIARNHQNVHVFRYRDSCYYCAFDCHVLPRSIGSLVPCLEFSPGKANLTETSPPILRWRDGIEFFRQWLDLLRVEIEHHNAEAVPGVETPGRATIHTMLISKPIGRARATGDRLFLGHGRSSDWRILKDFLAERLKLPWDEFNRECAVGLSTKERLQAMLDSANFAFLIMTAEDEHSGAIHARANVVHELGLFQGRLGFERAIILLEEGCAEFSNIHGLTQIRFPKGNIAAAFEEIRRVLEREGILAA